MWRLGLKVSPRRHASPTVQGPAAHLASKPEQMGKHANAMARTSSFLSPSILLSPQAGLGIIDVL